jgi:hypothetical protein
MVRTRSSEGTFQMWPLSGNLKYASANYDKFQDHFGGIWQKLRDTVRGIIGRVTSGPLEG